MAKQQAAQKFVFKIHSTRLRKAKWDLTLPLQQARRNEEVISLADNTVLRWIDELSGMIDTDEEVKKVRKEIKKLRIPPITQESKKQIKKEYAKLDKLQFRSAYLCLIIDKKQDYKRANEGFKINGIKYRRFLGTTGGIKNETIIYIDEKYFDEIFKRTENGRDLNKELVPAKLEAYRALTCSASIPVSTPKGILVVKDCETEFKANVIELDDTIGDSPKMTFVKNKEIKLNDSDGYGLILPNLSSKWSTELKEAYLPSGFCIRNSFCKGMLFTFDFIEFSKEIAKEEWVEDAWGDKRNINDIEIILTTSMLKLWDSYKSLEHYLECCGQNHYTFSVTKITPEELDNERTLNYQFIQSYNLSDKQIDELIKPTMDEIEDILGLDYKKSLLYLKGVNINEDSIIKGDDDFIKALSIDKRMMNDPFVRSRIHRMIKKKINDAKIGVINCKGNYSIISGDPYSLCQSIFGLKVTGLLKTNRYYSNYWNNKSVDKVACFRAPMTCHNNIRLLRLDNNEEMQRWYKYMNTVTIFNSWDTTTHALNGADKDSDSVYTTDNSIMVNNIRKLPAIFCVQKQAKKKVPTEEDIIISNINGFGDDIGSTTNRITSMFEKQALFDKNSKEFKELKYRIICGQMFQQNAIDKIKGIVAKPMNKGWYDKHLCGIKEFDSDETIQEKEFNMSILADKKPYFMKYIYPQTMNIYNTYVNSVQKKCLLEFKMDFDELLNINKKTNEQKIFIENYYKFMPVGISDCVMNKVCRKFEDKFDGYLKNIKEDLDFDYTILKSDTEYSSNTYDMIKMIYKDYIKKTQEHSKQNKKDRVESKDNLIQREIFKNDFVSSCIKVCPNEDELCNIVLDICYTNNNSKQFAWDVCGKTFIRNLLKLNGDKLNFPIQDDDGDIEFGGYNFKMIEMECDTDDNIE